MRLIDLTSLVLLKALEIRAATMGFAFGGGGIDRYESISSKLESMPVRTR
jgi:hypothetical protein